MKISLKFLLPLCFIVFVAIFYFWAISSKYDKQQYAKLTTKQYYVAENKDSIYSIITYNIGYLSGMTNNTDAITNSDFFSENLKKVINELKKEDADIICFQEIDYDSKRSYHVNQQNEIQKLGYNYTYQAVNWDINYLPFPGINPIKHYGEILSGQSILSKYHMKIIDRAVLDRPTNQAFYYAPFYIDRLAQVSKVNLQGTEVVLINVHLEAYDYDTRLAQTKEVAGIYKQYQNNYPTILIGDFNSDLKYERPTIKLILEIDGIATALLKPNNSIKTFPSENPTERLDYMFYNKKFITEIKSSVLTKFEEASDHLPLQMSFKLK